MALDAEPDSIVDEQVSGYCIASQSRSAVGVAHEYGVINVRYTAAYPIARRMPFIAPEFLAI